MELAAGNGERIQLFGPGHRYFQFCRSQGVVPLLEVDDLDQARAELVRDGAELLGRPESDGAWAWLTFRCGCYAVTGRGSRRCSGPDVHGIMSPVK